MSYLVFCVFDLRNASRDDYLYAYMDLQALGLRRIVESENGRSFTLPASAVLGMIDGPSVDDVRKAVGRDVQGIFKARNLSGDFFVVVSADWGCTGDSM